MELIELVIEKSDTPTAYYRTILMCNYSYCCFWDFLQQSTNTLLLVLCHYNRLIRVYFLF